MELQGIRFNRESVYATALTSTGIISRLHKGTFETPSAAHVRRQLLTGHVRLSENMAPDVFISMRVAIECLGMTDVPEIYQAAGDNNAANWTCAETCFISLQGILAGLRTRAAHAKRRQH